MGKSKHSEKEISEQSNHPKSIDNPLENLADVGEREVQAIFKTFLGNAALARQNTTSQEIQLHARRLENNSPYGNKSHNLCRERTALLKAAANIPNRDDFYKNIEQLEIRAHRKNPPISEEELEKVYRQMTCILNASDKDSLIPEKSRHLLVQDFILHAANPRSLCQGNHSTCNVTCVAQQDMTHRPSNLAAMVKSIALTGQWQAEDGKIIKVDHNSLRPGIKESNYPPGENDRSYATQIMNLTMVNDLLQRRNPPEEYREDPTAANQTPGRAFNHEMVYRNGKEIGNGQGLYIYATDIGWLACVKRHGARSLIVNDHVVNTGNDPNIIQISSQADLEKVLKFAKENNRLPLTVAVDKTQLHPPQKPIGIGHVINIMGVNPDGTVEIWDPRKQPGMERNCTITLETLYRATNSRRPKS